MRLLLLVLLLFAFGAGAAWLLRNDNGYVLLSHGPWVIETSVVAFLVALVVAVVLLMMLLRAVGAGLRLPETVREAMAQRRYRKQHHALVKGLRAWLAGRDERAEVALQKAMPENDEVAVYYLLAALAAEGQGQPERVRHYLERAAALNDSLTDEAIALQLSRQAQDDGALSEARERLQALRQTAPSHPRIYPALAEVLVAGREWNAALELLVEAEKARGWAPNQWQRLQHRALQGALEAVQRIEDAKQIWNALPKALRQDAANEYAYAEALHRLNAEKDCMAVIHRALEHRWAPEMAVLFLKAHHSDEVAALASVEQWLQRHGEQPELLLAAARTCRLNRLWGKARSYLDALLAQAPSAEAHYEYGLLCAQIEHRDESREHFQKGMELALTR